MSASRPFATCCVQSMQPTEPPPSKRTPRSAKATDVGHPASPHPPTSPYSASVVASRCAAAAAAFATGRLDAEIAANPRLRETLAAAGLDLDDPRLRQRPDSRFDSCSATPSHRQTGSAAASSHRSPRSSRHGAPPASSHRAASVPMKDIGGSETAARALCHHDFEAVEDPGWIEPRTARERELQFKLRAALQALHLCRDELKRRAAVALPSDLAAMPADASATGGTGAPINAYAARLGEAKPDWSLALRWRLTSELRGELDACERGWRADRQRHLEEVVRLERALAKEQQEKEAAVTRLTKDIITMQRNYASESVQGKTIWAILKPEIRHAERAHEWHADVLQREIDRLNTERSEATGTLQIEVVHLRDALCHMQEDLADEKARKQLMRDQLTTEVERLQVVLSETRRELEDATATASASRVELRRQLREAAEEADRTRLRLEKDVEEQTSLKVHIQTTLSGEVERLRVEKEKQAKAAKMALMQSEVRRVAETATLQARVTHLRELQQEALQWLPASETRSKLYMSSMKVDKPDSPYIRGDTPDRASSSGSVTPTPTTMPNSAPKKRLKSAFQKAKAEAPAAAPMYTPAVPRPAPVLSSNVIRVPSVDYSGQLSSASGARPV